MSAFFDESGTHEGSPFLCVAGYLFSSDQLLKLDGAWNSMLESKGIKYFRMSSCAHGNGIFKELSPQDCIDIETEAIFLIKEHMTLGYAVSLDMNVAHMIEKIPGPNPKWFNNPYTFTCYLCLVAVKKWIGDNNYQGEVAYFFESGHASQGDANKLMNRIFSKEELRIKYRYSSHSFADKANVRPLQCADLLSWQWFTYMKKIQNNLPPRKDFLALMQKEHFVQYVEEERIKYLSNALAEFS